VHRENTRFPARNGDSIVTGGGHVYLLSPNGLVDYRDRFFSGNVQKQRVFQVRVEVAKKEKKKPAAMFKNPRENATLALLS
jgi:hypothetical protein